MIQEAENKQQERSNLVKELSEQLVTLTLTRRSPRPVREVTIDDIAPEVQQEIVDQVKAQLKPVMEGMITATRDAGEQLKEEVDKIVGQVVEKTAELTATAARVEPESVS
jgi:cell division FtsZ-interacting protein ZapD